MAKKQKKSTPSARSVPTTSPARLGGPMDPQLLEQFVKLMRENDVTALEVSEGSHRISLQRGAAHTPSVAPQSSVSHAPVSPAVAKSSPPVEEESSSLKPITSPMVGTFYSSPSPDAKAFVQVGMTVNEDTDVCVIEAMKVFNNIKAEVRGTIAKVLVENGKSVEFGTVLFLVKP